MAPDFPYLAKLYVQGESEYRKGDVLNLWGTKKPPFILSTDYAATFDRLLGILQNQKDTKRGE
jgi:hypothetical protein